MVTAILTTIVVWCLFYGRLSTILLAVICIGSGLLLALLGRHSHSQFLAIDALAQSSRLNKVNAGIKFWSVLVLMFLCISARSPVVGILLAIVMLALTCFIGGLRLHVYMNLLALPVTFLLLSGLALLFEVSGQPVGVLNFQVLGVWFCVTTGAQATTALVMARALGAVTCLYLLSLTTPMSEIIGVLRRARCPQVIINLMYLIYRYLFVLLSMYHFMKDAAKSRLGYENYRTSVRTTGKVYSNLLARSYRQAGRNYDAMESRCFEEEIRFLEHRHKIHGVHLGVSGAIALLVLTLSLILWR